MSRRVNPDTGVFEEDGHGFFGDKWEPVEEDGREQRINPETGVFEEGGHGFFGNKWEPKGTAATQGDYDDVDVGDVDALELLLSLRGLAVYLGFCLLWWSGHPTFHDYHPFDAVYGGGWLETATSWAFFWAFIVSLLTLPGLIIVALALIPVLIVLAIFATIGGVA